MPGSGGSSVERGRGPGAAVCAPAPNFELLCAVYLKWYHRINFNNFIVVIM